VQMRKMRKSEEAGALIPGCIRELGETEMYVGPKLTDSLGHEQRMFGREALSYYFIKNEDTIFYLNSGRALRTYRWIFLERRVSGSMELYSFTTHGTSIPTFSRTSYTYYYFRMDGNWLNKKAIVWNETGKRKQLNQIFSKCTPALELIEATPSLMLDEILIQLVNLYNKSCQ
jgi:hypothetical protein